MKAVAVLDLVVHLGCHKTARQPVGVEWPQVEPAFAQSRLVMQSSSSLALHEI